MTIERIPEKCARFDENLDPMLVPNVLNLTHTQRKPDVNRHRSLMISGDVLKYLKGFWAAIFPGCGRIRLDAIHHNAHYGSQMG